LLRRSNEYILLLHSRLERRERFIQVLRNKVFELKESYPDEEILKDFEGFEFGDLDRIERNEEERVGRRNRLYDDAMEEDEGEGEIDDDVDMDAEEEEERKRKEKEKEKKGKKKSNEGVTTKVKN